MATTIAPVIEAAGAMFEFVVDNIPTIADAALGNGIVMVWIGVAIAGACFGFFGRLLSTARG